MDSMVSTAPSAWLTMQNAIEAYRRSLGAMVGFTVLVVFALIGTITGVAGMGDLFLILVGLSFVVLILLLHNLRTFLGGHGTAPPAERPAGLQIRVGFMDPRPYRCHPP